MSKLFVVLIVAICVGVLSFVPKLALLVMVTAVLTVPIASVSVRLTLWQTLSFLALIGYVVLSYGFANFSLHLGFPIPLGHLMAFSALFIAILGRGQDLKGFFKEPVAMCWLLLLVLSLFHLIVDVPKFGAYALRDASFVGEGVFLLLGFLWARKAEYEGVFLKSLLTLFLLNLAYSLTFPIAEVLMAHSPVSGIFQEVPLLGSYSHTPLFLVSGALFYLIVAKKITRWPSLILLSLALLQIGWSLVFQARSMYIGIIVALLVLAIFSNASEIVKIASGVVISIIGLFLILGSFNIKIPGRIGPVEPDFFVEHFRSVFLKPDTPAEGSVRWRLKLLPDVWDRYTASRTTILVGEGFGEPLIDFSLGGGVQVRQPHNTHLTVLVRLGLVGFMIWSFMHWRIASIFIRALRSHKKEIFKRRVILWFFIFYILGMLVTTVQPWLEFSYGAIPFFTLIGFALGFINRIPHQYRRANKGVNLSV
jgi:hypothetical protein